MQRAWTWLGILALTAGVIGLTDALTGPAPASAQGGAELTQPIPPAAGKDRGGSIRNKIGWTHASERWGENMPTGKGIDVAQVEAPFNGGYVAKADRPELAAINFIPKSGPAVDSGHATTVARFAFGPDSAGTGVRSVLAFSANHWITAGYLNVGTDLPPDPDCPARVFNHAWISRAQPGAVNALRRIDYAIDEYDVVFVVGVDNNPGDVPAMLAAAHNVISVGVASGNNTDGLTTLEGDGRAKPELVAPGSKTSWATGVVTGCVATLFEVADRMVNEAKENNAPRNKDAARSEVIKAVLLAGALKPKEWAPPQGEPLDRKLGAGVVEIDRSIVILEAGHVEPDTETDQRYGWSFAPVGSARQRAYTFKIDQRQGDTTFALTWHRRIQADLVNATHPRTGEELRLWNPRPRTADLDLALFKKNTDASEEQVALSASKVDNVELIHLNTLDPGIYELRVGRIEDEVEDAWDYALAWRIEAKE